MPAALATVMAILIFLVMGLLVAWGLRRGYASDEVAMRAVLTMVGLGVNVVATAILTIATMRGRRVWLVVQGWIVLAALWAVGLSLWSLVRDPGDAFWVVPPLMLFAVFSVMGLRNARAVSGGEVP